MTEQIDLDKVKGWFKHLVYGSPREGINELILTPGYDSSKLTVELKINGVELRVEDFNQVMLEWSNRIEARIEAREARIEEELVFLKSEEAAKERAREMFYKAINKLDWDEE